MPSKTQDETRTVVLDVRNLSPADLGRLGVQQLAYVKPVMVNGAHAFAIHAADGTPMRWRRTVATRSRRSTSMRWWRRRCIEEGSGSFLKKRTKKLS